MINNRNALAYKYLVNKLNEYDIQNNGGWLKAVFLNYVPQNI